ncbi:MAG: GNAT family N-acetyltransferase [Ignavibacteriaceae bacterium]
MNNKILIRKAIPSDVPAIIYLINELAEYEKLSQEVEITELQLHNALFGNETFTEVLIAEFESAISGYALFFKNFSTFKGKPGIYLEDLFVKPDFRGKGIGKALFESIIKTAKEKNYGRVEWSVLKWNQPAINFYEARGAAALDDWTIYRLTANDF